MNYTKALILRNLGCAFALTASLSALTARAQSNEEATDSTAAQVAAANLTETNAAPSSVIPAEAASDLPDAPGYGSSSSASADTASGPSAQQPAADQQYRATAPTPAASAPAASLRTRPTSPYDNYIDIHEIAPPLTSGDKVIMSFRATITPYHFISIVSAAGWEQLLDSSPNYGTNSEAFAQRVGAGALRRTSGVIFSGGVFAPLLHEDPRYYQLGPPHNLIARTTYAISRVFVTRKDDGDATPNLSLWLGNALTTGLTNAYYPQRSRNFSQTAEDFGGSLGGAAFSFFVREFLDEALLDAHLRKQE